MRPIVFLFLCITLLAFFEQANAQRKILIVTGGHGFEKSAFYELFDSFEHLEYDTVTQPRGNEMINSSTINNYDALVFYDMFQEITADQKAAYLDVLEKGKGMVFLHHSLVSYQDWPAFQQIVGGKYLLKKEVNNPKSTYKHDVDIDVHVVDSTHPITKGMKDFTVFDEVYGSFLVNDSVHPLLTTNHPESTKEIGWYHTYKQSRIVYLQSGHDHHAYENGNFRELVNNAITWVIAGN